MCDIEYLYSISLPRSREMEGGSQGLGEQRVGRDRHWVLEIDFGRGVILACMVMAM